MEKHGDHHWYSAADVAERLRVPQKAVERRMAEGLLPHRHIGADPALPHVHPDDVDRMVELGGLPYSSLEFVEAGGTVAQPERWIRVADDGSREAFIATCVLRVGRAPRGSAASVGGDLPPSAWRVLGPGDLLGDGEDQGLEYALEQGWVARLPADRGIIAALLAAERVKA
jgi:hypothetical protein